MLPLNRGPSNTGWDNGQSHGEEDSWVSHDRLADESVAQAARARSGAKSQGQKASYPVHLQRWAVTGLDFAHEGCVMLGWLLSLKEASGCPCLSFCPSVSFLGKREPLGSEPRR